MGSILNNRLRSIIVEVFSDRVLSKPGFKPSSKDVLFDILAELWVIWHGKNPPEGSDEHAKFCEDIQRCISLLTKEVQHA